MSLKGTVWSPMGPSPSPKAPLRTTALFPRSPSTRTTRTSSTWAPPEAASGAAATAVNLDPAVRPAVAARHRRAWRAGHRPQPHRHRLHRHQLPRIAQHAGRPVQVHRWRQQLGPARVGLSGRQHRQRDRSSPASAINVIIVDPGRLQTVYLASTRAACSARIDGGLNWTAGQRHLGDAARWCSTPHRPAANRILLRGPGRARGVFRQTTAGRTGRRF